VYGLEEGEEEELFRRDRLPEPPVDPPYARTITSAPFWTSLASWATASQLARSSRRTRFMWAPMRAEWRSRLGMYGYMVDLYVVEWVVWI